jgi:hypothetical protein
MFRYIEEAANANSDDGEPNFGTLSGIHSGFCLLLLRRGKFG